MPRGNVLCVNIKAVLLRNHCHRLSSNTSSHMSHIINSDTFYSQPPSVLRPCSVRFWSSCLYPQTNEPPVAMITCDLGVMLEITGGVSATALAYIFPAACYLRLLSPSIPWTSRTKLPAVLCAAFGGIVMMLSLFIALGKVWTGEGDAKICI